MNTQSEEKTKLEEDIIYLEKEKTLAVKRGCYSDAREINHIIAAKKFLLRDLK